MKERQPRLRRARILDCCHRKREEARERKQSWGLGTESRQRRTGTLHSSVRFNLAQPRTLLSSHQRSDRVKSNPSSSVRPRKPFSIRAEDIVTESNSSARNEREYGYISPASDQHVTVQAVKSNL